MFDPLSLTSEELDEIETRAGLIDMQDQAMLVQYGERAAKHDVPELIRALKTKLVTVNELASTIMGAIAVQLRHAMPPNTKTPTTKPRVNSVTVSILGGKMYIDSRIEFDL